MQQPPPGEVQQHFSLYETLEATYYAIAWKKDAKFFVSLSVLPITLLLVLFLNPSRSGGSLSLLVLGVSGLLILLAQPLNSFLHQNWKSVVSQDYFDQNGVFMSTFWSGPLLLVFAISSFFAMKDVFRSLKLPQQPSHPPARSQTNEQNTRISK